MNKYIYKDNEYILIDTLQDKTNNKEMALYKSKQDEKLYVRELSDFKSKFKKQEIERKTNTYFISLYTIKDDFKLSKFNMEFLDYAGLERLENIGNIIGSKEYLQEILDNFGMLEIRIRPLTYNEAENTINNKTQLTTIRASYDKDLSNLDITIYDEIGLKEELEKIVFKFFNLTQKDIKKLFGKEE